MNPKIRKGDIVVFRTIVWGDGDFSGIYSDHLHEVKSVDASRDFYEIKETMCWHHNRKKIGAFGKDIRLASVEEIKSKTRLPKTISASINNPKGLVFMIDGSKEILTIRYYTRENRLLVKDQKNISYEVDISEIREANTKEIAHHELMCEANQKNTVFG